MQFLTLQYTKMRIFQLGLKKVTTLQLLNITVSKINDITEFIDIVPNVALP